MEQARHRKRAVNTISTAASLLSGSQSKRSKSPERAFPHRRPGAVRFPRTHLSTTLLCVARSTSLLRAGLRLTLRTLPTPTSGSRVTPRNQGVPRRTTCPRHRLLPSPFIPPRRQLHQTHLHQTAAATDRRGVNHHRPCGEARTPSHPSRFRVLQTSNHMRNSYEHPIYCGVRVCRRR